jgi:TonB family protein
MVITLKQKIVSIEFDIQASEARLKEQINVNESNALVIVDGKEIPRDELKNIGPDKIESIDVIKSKAAVEKYGEKGNGGVVLITLKKDNPDTQTMKVQTDSPMKFHSIDGSGKQPLIVIDGVVNKNQNANNISPETIESITVLKSESAKATYGEKGKNGVVMITTKKGASNGEKESVTNLSGNFVAIDFNDKNSASSGLNFSAKKIQGDYKNGVTNIKADTIVFDTNSSSLFFIDGKESTKAEVDRLDPKKIESINVLKGESIVSKYGEKGKDGVIEITTKMASEAFTIVEEMPQFPGGIEALKKYVASTLQYPAIALENGITGQVYVNFIVAQDGSITDAKIARRVDPSLDKEALRIVNNMPKWKPGSQAGKNVKVSYSMPIKFNIPEDYHPKSKEMLRKGTSRIGNINWINNTVYTSAELNKTFGLKKGDKYTKEQLQGIISGPVSSLYLDKGYVFSKIDIAETPMGDGNNNLTFTVYEGIRGKIGRIDVKGNKNVSSEDILRKIKIKPGDLFSKTKIIQSIEAINKMGKFNSEEIRPEIIPDSNNSNQEFGTVNIIFNVTEK